MSTAHESNTWQLQEAKAKFSQLVRSTVNKPQIITSRGEETAVVLSMKDYRELKGEKQQTIWEFFHNSPFRDVELEMPEYLPNEKMREIDW
jgi:prevent-host-death family protein